MIIFAIHIKLGYQCSRHDYLDRRTSLVNLHERTLLGEFCLSVCVYGVPAAPSFWTTKEEMQFDD